MTQSCEPSRVQVTGDTPSYSFLYCSSLSSLSTVARSDFLYYSSLTFGLSIQSITSLSLFLHYLHSFMPRQQLRSNRAPYTQLFSALRKPDLIQLCGEFRLSPEGSVITLKERLRDYINLNRDRVYQNPRYTALFPRHQKPQRNPSPQTDSIPSSPPVSSRSVSPIDSEASWHGIGRQFEIPNTIPPEDRQQQHFEHQPSPQHEPPLDDQPPQPHQHQGQHPIPPEEPIMPPSEAASNRGSVPPITFPDNNSKYYTSSWGTLLLLYPYSHTSLLTL
jgi:hypothetical protein